MGMGIRDTQRYAKEMILDYIDGKIIEQIKYHQEEYTELVCIIAERNTIAKRYGQPKINYIQFSEKAKKE